MKIKKYNLLENILTSEKFSEEILHTSENDEKNKLSKIKIQIFNFSENNFRLNFCDYIEETNFSSELTYPTEKNLKTIISNSELLNSINSKGIEPNNNSDYLSIYENTEKKLKNIYAENINTKNIFALKIIDKEIDFNILNSDDNLIEEKKIQFENLTEENSELGKLNEILEREINLLKSLILINNLNSTNNERENDQRQNYNKNYFIEMCNDNNLQELGKDDGLFKKHKTLHTLMMKIKVK